MTKDAILALVRHLLTFGGGFVTADSLASADEITTLVSAIVTAVGVIWSILDKRKKRNED